MAEVLLDEGDHGAAQTVFFSSLRFVIKARPNIDR
jgi:hypothetical protein